MKKDIYTSTLTTTFPNVKLGQWNQCYAPPPLPFGTTTQVQYARKIEVPDVIQNLIQRIHALGIAETDYVIAGGCVRDLLLNRNFRDVDVWLSKRDKHRIESVGAGSGIIPSYNANLIKDEFIVDGLHVDFIANQPNFIEAFDYTINQFFISPALTAKGCAQSWFDMDYKILRFNHSPDLATVIRGLRFSILYNLSIDSRTYLHFQQVSASEDTISDCRWLREFTKAEQSGILELLFAEMQKLQIKCPLPYPDYYQLLKFRRDSNQYNKTLDEYEDQ